MTILQMWLQKNDGDVQKAYQALFQELEQYGNRHGATALVDERGEELEALMQLEAMLGKEKER